MSTDKETNRNYSLLVFMVSILAFIISCSSDQQENEQLQVPPGIDSGSSVKKEIIKQEEDSLADTIFKLFDFKTENFQYKTYYHKNWWGRYTIRDNALLCGVDSAGKLFLISNLLVPDSKINHTSVTVIIGGTILQSSTVQSDNLQHAEPPGTITIQANVYTAPQDSVIIAAIAGAGQRPVVVKFNKTNRSLRLSLRDKKAITDCYFLSRQILSRKENK